MEVLLKHTFQDGNLLLEVCTHPSWPSWLDTIPSNQRQEFLGDAAVDLFVTLTLFARYP